MQFKSLALTAAALLATYSGVLHADAFEPQGIRVGVDYRIPFGGSVRVKPEAPSFGFTVELAREQNRFGMGDYTPTLSSQSAQFNKLMDMRFDSKTQNLRSMYVGGVSVLKTVSRVNVDGTPGVIATEISWPMVAVGMTGFALWANNQVNNSTVTPVPDSCTTVGFNQVSEAVYGVTVCTK
jgi:hypothetical protein